MSNNLPLLQDLKGQQKQLRHRLYDEIEGFRATLEAPNTLQAAQMVRKWVSERATYPQRDLLILHWRHTVPEILDLLERDVGGLWCGGAAFVLAYALNACYIPACVYSYGAKDVSHETVVFGQTRNEGKTYNFYILDAYLNFHYVYPGTPTWMPVPELWRRIRAKQYESIERVDVRIERNLVTSTKDAAYYKWLFDHGVPERPIRVTQGHSVYPGATHSIQKVLVTGPFREVINAARQDQPIDEFMLDLMLVKPVFGPMIQIPAAYPETSLLRSMIDSFIEEPAWAKEGR